MTRARIPEVLNICLTAFHFPIMGRTTDQGFLWPIAKGLAQKGHQVTVLAAKSPLGKQEVHRDGVRVFYLHEGFPNFSDMPFEEAIYLKFLELHTEIPFHIIHSMDRSAYKIGLHRRKLRVALAYDVQATQMSRIFTLLGRAGDTAISQLRTALAVSYSFLATYLAQDRKLLSTAHGIFVTSPQQRMALERYYLYPDWSVYTVPYGLEIGDLAARENKKNLYSKMHLPEDSHIILTHSEMVDPTELKSLLKAFEKVAIKKLHAYLIILGSGPKMKEVEFEVLNLALGTRVLMPGPLSADEVSDYIDLASVYVNMSSTHTGLEPVMIEAMSQKKVIIGSEVSPMANIVEDGVDGFLLRPADVESLSGLLLEIFSGSIPTQEIGERARAKVVNIFDVKKMISGLEMAYFSILQKSFGYVAERLL